MCPDSPSLGYPKKANPKHGMKYGRFPRTTMLAISCITARCCLGNALGYNQGCRRLVSIASAKDIDNADIRSRVSIFA